MKTHILAHPDFSGSSSADMFWIIHWRARQYTSSASLWKQKNWTCVITDAARKAAWLTFQLLRGNSTEKLMGNESSSQRLPSGIKTISGFAVNRRRLASKIDSQNHGRLFPSQEICDSAHLFVRNICCQQPVLICRFHCLSHARSNISMYLHQRSIAIDNSDILVIS